MRNRTALMLVVGLIACAVAQAQIGPGLLGMFLSWPLQDIERRQAMYQAGFPAVVFTTRPPLTDNAATSNAPEPGREVVAVATRPDGQNRVSWDTEVEFHLSYALGEGSIEEAYAVIGGARAEANKPTKEPEKANRFGTFDRATQILRISYAEKVEVQRRYDALNHGVFREEFPVQIVCVNPKGERKDKSTQGPWTLFFKISWAKHRAVYMSQAILISWENETNWVYGNRDELDALPPTTARVLREQTAALRMWQRTAVDVAGDTTSARMFGSVEAQMQLWVSSAQVSVEFLDRQQLPTSGPRITGLIMFFPMGATVRKPWLPGLPVEWKRLIGKNLHFPSYVEDLLQRHPDVPYVPYILLWKGGRSHAHFMIHQVTLNALPEDMQVAFLAISQPVADPDYHWWDWAEGGVDGAVIPLAPGSIEHRVIAEVAAGASLLNQEINLNELMIGIRPLEPSDTRGNGEETVQPPIVRP